MYVRASILQPVVHIVIVSFYREFKVQNNLRLVERIELERNMPFIAVWKLNMYSTIIKV